MPSPRRILITGARDWADEATITQAITDHLDVKPGAHNVVVHGACPTGADQIADKFCEDAGTWTEYSRISVMVERHPADWDRHGKSAGPRRNQKMVNLGADICLAFIGKNSRGTVHCANAADAAGIPVVRWYA